MSRMWLKNGRAVLTDGRAVLCEECPCGCSYTYYVDHSLATSGDGHSWETAFNSVNDVFNSLEIYNYRLSGCTIYIKIKGAITYRLAGTYLFHGAMSESNMFGYVHLMAQDDSSTVTCNLVTPFIVTDSFLATARVHVHNFNITTSEPSIALSTDSIIFSDCVIVVNVPLETFFENISSSFGNASGFCLYRCIITINLGVRNIGQKGTLSYTPIFNIIDSVVSNTSIIITGELTESGSIYTRITITAINPTQRSSILENVVVSSNISFSGFGWVSVYAFNGSGTNLFSGCTFSPQIAETHQFGKIICAFGAGVVRKGSFYNCSQYCDADGSFTCSQSCPDLS